jgi:hypothetical protein
VAEATDVVADLGQAEVGLVGQVNDLVIDEDLPSGGEGDLADDECRDQGNAGNENREQAGDGELHDGFRVRGRERGDFASWIVANAAARIQTDCRTTPVTMRAPATCFWIVG